MGCSEQYLNSRHDRPSHGVAIAQAHLGWRSASCRLASGLRLSASAAPPWGPMPQCASDSCFSGVHLRPSRARNQPLASTHYAADNHGTSTCCAAKPHAPHTTSCIENKLCCVVRLCQTPGLLVLDSRGRAPFEAGREQLGPDVAELVVVKHEDLRVTSKIVQAVLAGRLEAAAEDLGCARSAHSRLGVALRLHAGG
jgi:hypothetical protein